MVARCIYCYKLILRDTFALGPSAPFQQAHVVLSVSLLQTDCPGC